MEDISKFVDSELLKAKKIFNNTELYKHIIIEDICCSELPPIETNGKELPKSLIDKVFSKLHQYDKTEIEINLCPAIYVFELENKSDREKIIELFKKAKDELSNRVLPALKNEIPNSKYLYVGKVEKAVGGRIVTHLGYYQSKGNHGLQLAYWTRDVKPGLKLNLHVFRFNEDFKPFISAMEVLIAKELQPIIGKH